MNLTEPEETPEPERKPEPPQHSELLASGSPFGMEGSLRDRRGQRWVAICSPPLKLS